MAEQRQTIIERIVRIAFELAGAEEVEEKIREVTREGEKLASVMMQDVESIKSFRNAFRDLGKTLSVTTLQQLPQMLTYLQQFSMAMIEADDAGRELTPAMYAMSEEGRNLATSLGLVVPKMEETETAGAGLKDAFWKLNSVARGLLRVFVAFKVLTGVIGIFRDMAEATVNLQREMWSLRVIISGAGQEIEGGLGSWDEWLERLNRMREELRLIDMTNLVRGAKTLIVTLDQLGLTADQMEFVIQLAGEMSIIMGQEFPSYAQRVSTALQGQTRNWAALGINLTESSGALQEYTEQLGYNWDELNQQQKVILRTLFLTREMIRITEESTGVAEEEWAVLEALRAKRADLIAQQPNLIQFQNMWNQLLILGTELAAKAAEAITRFFATIVSGISATFVVLAEINEGMKKGEAAFDSFSEGAARWHEVQDEIYEGIISGATVLDYLGEKLDETGEKVEEAVDPFSQLEEAMKLMIDGAADAGDAAEEFGERVTRALRQAQSALRSYLSAVEQAGIRLGRRLADIARNLEEKLADLESRFEARRDQLIRRFEERRAEIREDAAEKEEELRKDLNKRLRRMEEDHQNEMRELREDYLLDLEEAARKRDAVSMRRIQQRYILEKKQRERDHEIRRRRAIEDYHEQLDELRKAREEQERELEKSLERQLQELQENYERQQEEARLNAERQREDALRNYQEQLNDLWRSFQDRLETIALNLMEEEEEWKVHLGDLRIFFDKWYEDDLVALKAWLTKRAIILKAQEWIESLPPWMRPFIPPIPQISMAQGGAGVARSPTQITVGESGAEMFAAWPLGQRIPRLGADIRLTIDGTQMGAWSVDFENQVIRIFREVLQEAGL